MQVGDVYNWMGTRAIVSRIESEDHFWVEIGPETNRYEVEVQNNVITDVVDKSRSSAYVEDGPVGENVA